MPSPSIEERFNPESAEVMKQYAGKGGGGALPELLGIELVEMSPGTITAKGVFTDDLITMSGNVHGGAMAAMIDHVTGMVVYPLIPAGSWAATTELKLNYIAPMQAGEVRIEASVLAITNRSAVVRGEIYNGDKLLVAAQGTITIVPPRA